MIPLMWSGVVLDPSGYGEASRGYLGELSKTDLKTKVIQKSFHKGDSVSFPQHFDMLSRLHATELDKTKPYVFLQHLTPEQYLLGAGACKYHIGMTTFETNSIPGMWQMPLRAMDEVFTFSKWSKMVFESVGIRRPITVIPHGVDVTTFRPGRDPNPKLEDAIAGRFAYGANFDWTERKNPGALIRAFWTTFKPEDDVVLVLKTYNQFVGPNQKAFFQSYLAQIKQELGITKAPPVILFTDMLSGDQVPAFYSSLNCYALPSRGEGWGLTYSEAMSCGLPVVAVNWSGHTEFMNDQNSVLVNDFKLQTVKPEQCPNQPYYAGQQWADVNVEAFGQAMLSVYTDGNQRSKGMKAREHMVRNYQWSHCTQIMRDRLAVIMNSI